MKISIAHVQPRAREVLERALTVKLDAKVTGFGCVEDLLSSSMNYDVFVVYNNFGHRMSGTKGVIEIRAQLPDAFIIGVSNNPNLNSKFLIAGADAFLLRAGNEIEELIGLIHGHDRDLPVAATPAG